MEENSKAILDLLVSKSALKQDISEDSVAAFNLFKTQATAILQELKEEVKDARIRLNLVEKSSGEFQVFIGSDVLVFQVHTNVFKLPETHALWKTPYLQEDESRGYFGIIHIYNFLAESFIQNRLNDAGYLIGRMFVNHEGHYFVEGKGQLGFLFKGLADSTLTPEIVKHIVQCSFAYALDFDLYLPPYELIHELSVGQVQSIGNMMQIGTGKRVGFKFQAEVDQNNF